MDGFDGSDGIAGTATDPLESNAASLAVVER